MAAVYSSKGVYTEKSRTEDMANLGNFVLTVRCRCEALLLWPNLCQDHIEIADSQDPISCWMWDIGICVHFAQEQEVAQIPFYSTLCRVTEYLLFFFLHFVPEERGAETNSS